MKKILAAVLTGVLFVTGLHLLGGLGAGNNSTGVQTTDSGDGKGNGLMLVEGGGDGRSG